MIAPSRARDGDIGRDDGSIRLDWFQSDTSDLDKLEGQGLHVKRFDALERQREFDFDHVKPTCSI
jgi:hypothetical protein